MPFLVHHISVWMMSVYFTINLRVITWLWWCLLGFSILRLLVFPFWWLNSNGEILWMYENIVSAQNLSHSPWKVLWKICIPLVNQRKMWVTHPIWSFPSMLYQFWSSNKIIGYFYKATCKLHEVLFVLLGTWTKGNS